MPRVLLLIVLLAAAGVAAAEDRDILASDSYFRTFAMCRTPVIPASLQADGAADQPFGVLPELATPPPPAGWRAADFDDASWLRYRGPFPGRAQGWTFYRGVEALMAIRGRFTVTDPAKVGRLTLSLAYSGGVAVYLNGTEVARAHLPAGELTPDTLGEPYPKAAYVDPQGKLVTHQSDPAAREAADSTRRRQIGPLDLPRDALRKGVNVLAVELHRSGHRPEAIQWQWNLGPGWAHLGLDSLQLRAEGEGIRPNVGRPDGVQVWNADIHQVLGADDWGDPNEPLRPIRLCGARNGDYSGQVVVSGDGELQDVRAAASDLAAAGGRIAAADVQVRYPHLSGLGLTATFFPGRSSRPEPAFLPLHPTPAAKGRVQPAWITVHVPADAAAGAYRGTLTVSAGGLPAVAVPVELEVVDWALPDPRHYGTFMGFYQSPESVAIQYGVDLWSEKHWALLENSFRLGGYVGNRLVILPLVCRTQFGNDESMVRWVRQADGSYEYDFTVFDRYVALAQKYWTPEIVSCEVWTPYGGGYHLPNRLPDKPTCVAVVDPQKNTREMMQLPAFGAPEALALWRPYIQAVKARLKQRDLDAAMVLGIHSDSFTTYEVTEMFAKIDPALQWHRGAHGRGGSGGRGYRYAYREYLYVPNAIGPPQGRKNHGWDSPERVVISQRLYDPWQPPLFIRTLGERGLLLCERGGGRMCLDYWPVAGSQEEGSLFNRWPASSSAQRRPFIRWLLAPGPDGAIPTIKVEAMHEGLQDNELRIFLEKALLAGRLPEDLAARARDALDRKAQLVRVIHSNGAYGVTEPMRWTCDAGWDGLSALLYRLAAEAPN